MAVNSNIFEQKYTKLEKSLITPTIIWGGGNIKDLIPLKEACKLIGVSYKTLYSWVSNNEISYTKIGTRYYLSQGQLKALVFVDSKDLTHATE